MLKKIKMLKRWSKILTEKIRRLIQRIYFSRRTLWNAFIRKNFLKEKKNKKTLDYSCPTFSISFFFLVMSRGDVNDHFFPSKHFGQFQNESKHIVCYIFCRTIKKTAKEKTHFNIIHHRRLRGRKTGTGHGKG